MHPSGLTARYDGPNVTKARATTIIQYEKRTNMQNN